MEDASRGRDSLPEPPSFLPQPPFCLLPPKRPIRYKLSLHAEQLIAQEMRKFIAEEMPLKAGRRVLVSHGDLGDSCC